MATASWNPDAPVATHETAPLSLPEATEEERAHAIEFGGIRKLLDNEVFRVEFFQAVRLLQMMEKDRQPVGYFFPHGSEAVKFSAHTTLAFPPSQLYDLHRDADGQAHLVVQFMGVCASITIMPIAYAENLLGELKNKEYGQRDFYDLFNHRMISLFYRGWEKYRLFVGYESGEEDRLTPRVLDFLGLGTEGLRNRTSLPDEAYVAYCGLLGRHNRSAGALKQILEDYFEVPITIVQFAGTWRTLPEENRTTFDGFEGTNELLGVGTVVGSEVWDHHGRIRISIGPIGYKDYLTFLPGAGAYRDLEAWVSFYSSEQYEAEVQLILQKEDAPGCELGAEGPEASRLGLVSWLKTRPLPRDPGDALFLLG